MPPFFDSDQEQLKQTLLWHMLGFIYLHDSAATILAGSQNRQGEWEFAEENQKIAQWDNAALVWSWWKEELLSGKKKKKRTEM